MRLLLERWREFSEGASMCHKPSDGTFTDCEAGAVKSLSKDGARRAGVDPKFAERGVVTSKGKVQAKMGANFGKDQCGGIDFQTGKRHNPKFKCSDYKEPYKENIEALENLESVPMDDLIEAMWEIHKEVIEMDEANGCDCSKYRSKWLQDLLRTINAVAISQKGELNKTESLSQPKKQYDGSKIKDDKERKTDRRKAADRRRKLRAMMGVYVEPFNRGEKELLTPNSLWQ